MTNQRGFTLIELAIVLVIITILIGGLAVPLSAQIQARRIAETNRTLDEAREAIIGYAMSNTIQKPCDCIYDNPSGVLKSSSDCPGTLCPQTGIPDSAITLHYSRHYLPCPDLIQADPEPGVDNDGVSGLTDLNNGAEDRYISGSNQGACAASSGNLPWVTLGTAAQDAWGNRLRYGVTATLAKKSEGLPGTGGGDLQVCSASGCAAVNVASNVPAVLVSYGPNGWGARNINGNTLATPTSADELENTNSNLNYVSRTPSKAGDAAGEFDDLVRWISADQLRGRICPAGGCP